jgi:phytoene dehydrogenase-like protein
VSDFAVDVIVIGAGHNSLVCAGRLARRGLEVLVLERAAEVGGGCSRVEDNRVPGLQHQVHSVFHRGITAMPWFQELDLERHGVRYLEPEANVALHLSDGRALVMHTTQELTVQSIARFDADDARTWEVMAREWLPVLGEVIGPLLESPPEPAAARAGRLSDSDAGRTFLELAARRPIDVVTRYFRHPAVRALLCAIMVLREVDIIVPGQGFQVVALAAGRRRAQLYIGGSKRLAEGLAASLHAAGGRLWTGVLPRRLVVVPTDLVDRGRALEDGRSVRAGRCVVSGINPQQTFLELLGAHCPSPLRAAAEGYRYSAVGPLFGLHLALRQPPRYRSEKFEPAVARRFMHIFGADGPEAYTHLYPECEAGRIPSPIALNGAVPTVLDPSLRGGDGEHAAFVWQKVPYAVAGDPRRWDGMGAAQGQAVLARWREYADGLEPENIVNSFTNTPLDTERRLPNMVGGDLNVGHLAPDQEWDSRQSPGSGGYRTPVPGLYLCGAATHPYGNVTGLCGHNAATVITSELGL